MGFGHKLGGLKRTNWDNKKPLQKVQTLKKHFETLGYKVPSYLQKNKLTDTQFNSALNRITKGYTTRVEKEKKYTQKRVPISKKELTNKLAKNINELNRTIDKTIDMLKGLGYSDKQIDFLKGNPTFGTTRKKPYFSDNEHLKKEDIDNLVNKSADDIKNSIKRIKEKTKNVKPKNYLKKITNSYDSDIFFEELIEEDFMEDLNNIEVEHLRNLWHKLEPMEKEIAIKNVLSDLREKYREKYSRDWSDSTSRNCFDHLVNYLNGAVGVFEIKF